MGISWQSGTFNGCSTTKIALKLVILLNEVL